MTAMSSTVQRKTMKKCSRSVSEDIIGEVIDQMLKRMSYIRQKRGWNVYMLLYTRLDVQEQPLVNNLKQLSLPESKLSLLMMPEPIEQSVIRQNITFMHNRNHLVSVAYRISY